MLADPRVQAGWLGMKLSYRYLVFRKKAVLADTRVSGQDECRAGAHLPLQTFAVVGNRGCLVSRCQSIAFRFRPWGIFMTMSRTVRCSAAGLLGLSLAGVGLVSASAAQAATPTKASSCITIKITGKKVAVRIPDRGDTVADSNDPVARYVYRGDKLKSCVIANGYGTSYNKCNKKGYDWYIVTGGQVPLTCAKRA